MIYILMLVGLLVNMLTAAQNLRELAREHARKFPGVPVELASEPGDYLPKTIEDLTKEADVVLQATLSLGRPYLAQSEDRILTDYSIDVERVIAGSVPARVSPTPGASTPPLVLTVLGGSATIDGVLIRSEGNLRDALKDGGRYLLFLMNSRRREPGRYEIYYGGVFELVHERARPLLRNAERVFRGVTDSPINDLIVQIEKVAHGR